MAVFFDWVTIITTIYLCIKYFRRTVTSSRYIIYYLFVVLYCLPLVFDRLIMMPDYTLNWYINGFLKSYDDEATRIIYDIALVYCQIIILRYHNNRRQKDSIDCKAIDIKMYNYKGLLLSFMVFPTFLCLILPANKGMIYTFQWRELGLFSYDKYAMWAEKIAYIGVCCSILYIFDKESKWYQKILGVLFAYFNICLQGKRSILFFALVFGIIVLIPGLRDSSLDVKKRNKKLFGLIIIASIAVVSMVAVTSVVQTNRFVQATSNYIYTTTRIDFFRDDRVRMVIYGLIHPGEIQQLRYPGESLLPIPLWLFPFDIISNALGINPDSYQVYFSAAMEGVNVEISNSLMTPCMFAELISNFGYLGLLIMPFVCLWFAKQADKYKFPMNILIIIVFVSLQLYAIKYISYLVESVIFLYLNTKIRFVIQRDRRSKTIRAVGK